MESTSTRMPEQAISTN